MNNRFNRGGPRERSPPVNVGDELQVTVEAVGAKGDGICKKDGFVLFVPGVKEGQTLTVRVTKVFNRLGFAEPLEGGSSAAAEAPQKSYPKAAKEPAPEDSEDFGEEDSGSSDSEDFGDDDAGEDDGSDSDSDEDFQEDDEDTEK